MTTLSQNWFYTGTLDFEYQKYLLLAYLQYVNRHFRDTKLYPSLGELVQHYRNLNSYLDSKRKLDDGFPKEIEGIDPQRLRIMYKKVLQDDHVLDTIEQIVQYAAPLMKEYLDNGKEMYDFIEENLALFPVGLVPLYKDEGYLFIANHGHDILVYGYELSKITSAGTHYRSIATTFLHAYKRSIMNTYNHIKSQLMRSYQHLPNPATYVVESEIKVPVRETLLPIAKRLLAGQLGS